MSDYDDNDVDAIIAADRERIATAIETERARWETAMAANIVGSNLWSYYHGKGDGHTVAARIARTEPEDE